ncbi:lamin tail domain-containing protein [Actinokineospora auranticolor]|uniref:Phytase-like protein with esterase activity n=1 Tax=Actinokineospora auranticolor TaxID=155976 RepID=A0A2S6GUC2_9PSEU|nr:lamin tail domain-containing protein [Actinokineospora auranticolor]PPK68842.1 phytase-like protein with esterase activity [Actinokineospora auranticolor]
MTESPWRRARVVVCASLMLGAFAAVPAQAAPADDIRINEVVTTGTVNDSIELYNKGTSAVDISGWVLKDDNNSSNYTIAAGTTLNPGAARAFDVHGKFGLGSDDDARLYLANGTTLVDSFGWTSHSAPSWSRCPNGTGSFTDAAITLGAPNDCLAATSWPGGSSVSNADASNAFGSDVSGLYQESSGVLWAAQNSGKLWRLVPNGTGGWKADTANGWTSGKTLRYTGGSGAPDSEGVTVPGTGGVFISSERNGDASGTSRLSVLRYDVSGSGTSLTATQEWNLTAGLPSVGSNLGFEAITWIPDATLTATGFSNEATGAAYNPSLYGAHTGGVFFVALEGNATVYGYVLQDSGTATKVATIASGMDGVMELQWEPQASRLWVVCDNTCDGEHRTFTINASGVFATAAVYNRPSGMPNYNNEGFTLAGAGECASGSKPVYWADDSNDSGHALRRGTVNC